MRKRPKTGSTKATGGSICVASTRKRLAWPPVR